MGYSRWGHKELDTTERLILSLSLCYKSLDVNYPSPHLFFTKGAPSFLALVKCTVLRRMCLSWNLRALDSAIPRTGKLFLKTSSLAQVPSSWASANILLWHNFPPYVVYPFKTEDLQPCADHPFFKALLKHDLLQEYLLLSIPGMEFISLPSPLAHYLAFPPVYHELGLSVCNCPFL